MKILLTISFVLFASWTIIAQDTYIHVTTYGMGNKHLISIDYGQKMKGVEHWTDDAGEKVKFHSPIQAMNYLSNQFGFVYVQPIPSKAMTSSFIMKCETAKLHPTFTKLIAEIDSE